ncbi:hypothetical protein CYK37_13750 [Mesorhizobium loti]|nr:hypothetical protein CYK37_13750 [Mesorhizobium loti]
MHRTGSAENSTLILSPQELPEHVFGFFQQSLNLSGAHAIEMAEHVEDTQIQFGTPAVQITDFLWPHQLRQRVGRGAIVDLALCKPVAAYDFRSQFNRHFEHLEWMNVVLGDE